MTSLQPLTLTDDVRAISASGNHYTCAIVATGDLKCWGERGGRWSCGQQLPRCSGVCGSYSPCSHTLASVPSEDLDGHKAIAHAAGGHHNCALLETGR